MAQQMAPRSLWVPGAHSLRATRGTMRQNSLAGLGWQDGAGLFTGQSHAQHFRWPLLSRTLDRRGENPHPWTVPKADNKQATGLRNEGPPTKTALWERSVLPRHVCRVESVLRWGFSKASLCRCTSNLLGQTEGGNSFTGE